MQQRPDAHPVAGAPWRDVTLFFQDEDPAIGSHKMPYSATVSGVVDAVHLHVLAPWSEQAQVFSVEGHTWPVEPGERGTTHVSSTALVGLDALDLELDGGAGGPPTPRARTPTATTASRTARPVCGGGSSSRSAETTQRSVGSGRRNVVETGARPTPSP